MYLIRNGTLPDFKSAKLSKARIGQLFILSSIRLVRDNNLLWDLWLCFLCNMFISEKLLSLVTPAGQRRRIVHTPQTHCATVPECITPTPAYTPCGTLTILPWWFCFLWSWEAIIITETEIWLISLTLLGRKQTRAVKLVLWSSLCHRGGCV